MNIALLTFNLENNKGYPKLMRLLDIHKPDVVALQEVDMSKDVAITMKKEGYELAGYEKTFRRFSGVFSVATFYRAEGLSFQTSSTILFQRGIIELIDRIIWGLGNRLVIASTFSRGPKKFCVYNLHLYPYSATHIRSKQFERTLKEAQAAKIPTIILGDFNYPYNRSTMEELMKKYSFHEATSNIFHTFFKKALKFLPLKFKLDYIFYRDIEHVETKRLDSFTTDHTPILSRFRL